MVTNTLLKYLRTILKLETDLRTLSVSMKKNRQQVAKFSQTYVVTKPKIDCYGHGIYGFLWDCFISLCISYSLRHIYLSFHFDSTKVGILRY